MTRPLSHPLPEERGDRPAGYLIWTMRSTFRDLSRVYGSEGARQIVAEIINDEFERSSRHG